MSIKKYTAICLFLAASANFGCQKSDLKQTKKLETSKSRVAATLPRMTFRESLFAGKIEWKNPISQFGENEDIRRQLYSYADNSFANLKKYLLMEEDLTTQEIKQCNVISLKTISGSVNLFAIPWKNEDVIYYRDAKVKLFSANVKSKIVLKFKNTTSDLNNELDRLPACDGGGTMPVCIDWYWTEYNTDTGEIINETYISTTCYDPCTDTGGGNGGGDDPNLDPEVEAFKTYHWKVWEPETHFWQIYSWEALRGKRVIGEPQGGHFTKATHLESICNGGNVLYFETENLITFASQWITSKIKGSWKLDTGGPFTDIEGEKLMGFNKIFP